MEPYILKCQDMTVGGARNLMVSQDQNNHYATANVLFWKKALKNLFRASSIVPAQQLQSLDLWDERKILSNVWIRSFKYQFNSDDFIYIPDAEFKFDQFNATIA